MLTTGAELAGYRIEGVLGSGGMGTVYEATQLSLQRVVALKVLATHLSGDEAFRERFRREATLQAGLDHPHVVTVHEFGEIDEGLFIATRFVRGTDLRRLIDGGIAPTRALAILEQAASALDAAHAAGLVHRDVKPQNILVDEHDVAYLADFGLAREAAARGPTRVGEYAGTLDYVSPEQIRGEPATARSDVYALAAVLYECLSGEVPFARDTDAALLYAHLEEPPPKLTDRRAGLPQALDDAVARGLAKDPADRFENATELVAAARRALERAAEALVTPPRPDGDEGPRRGETIVERTLPRPAPVVTVDEPRRVPAEWLLAGFAVLAALWLLGFFAGRLAHREPGEPARGVAVGGAIALSFPADEWEALQAAPDIPGLTLDDPIVLTSAGEGAATLAAGLGREAQGPRLLPPSLLALLERTPRREAVRLGSVTALRYRNLRHRRVPGELTIYAVPTTRGVATIACQAVGPDAREALADCEAVATTVALRGAQALPLGANVRYATAVNTALAALEEQRRDGRRALAEAETRAAQGRAAEGLASAFAATASALERAAPGPVEQGVHQALVASLRRTAEAYTALAAAADEGALSWDRAAAAVSRGEEAIDASLDALGRLGYRVSRS